MKQTPLAVRTITIDCDDLSDKEVSRILDNLETIDWDKFIRIHLGDVPGLRISVES